MKWRARDPRLLPAWSGAEDLVPTVYFHESSRWGSEDSGDLLPHPLGSTLALASGNVPLGGSPRRSDQGRRGTDKVIREAGRFPDLLPGLCYGSEELAELAKGWGFKQKRKKESPTETDEDATMKSEQGIK